MKHFINILVILILTGFAVGLTNIMITTQVREFGFLYLPIIIFMLLWGVKLYNDYNN